MKCVALFCAPRALNHSAPPKGLVPGSNWNLADAPEIEGEAIPCAMEKTAAGVPVHEPKQDCQPVSFWMSGMVVALGLLGEDEPGLGLGAAMAMDVGAACPPHPASAERPVKTVMTRLGRNRFFSFSIRGTLRVAKF